MTQAMELAERDIRAFNEQDMEAKLAISSPALVFVVPGVTLRGVEEAGGFARALWEAFPDGHIGTREGVADETRAAVEGTFSATHVGTLRTPGGEIAATGRRVEFPYVLVYEVDGGRIVSKHFYFDRLDLLTQIGAIPAPAPA
ncbi:MAG: ester cyclase [Actinomycetota bacterium]